MVDLSGGPDGPIEHGFSNTVFIIPAIVVIGLAVPRMGQSGIDRQAVQDQIDGLGSIEDGVPIPEDFVHEVPAASTENLIQTLRNIEGLSPEEKLELEEQLLRAMAEDSEVVSSSVFFNQTIIFLLALSLIVSILAVNMGSNVDDVSIDADDTVARRAELRKLIQEHLKNMSEHVGDFQKFAESLRPPFWTDRMLLMIVVPLIVSVFAFFGLKLYRSLSERERKREEKRKLKQQKKKK